MREVETVPNLIKTTIFAATKDLAKPWCISVFEDNSGVIEFDQVAVGDHLGVVRELGQPVHGAAEEVVVPEDPQLLITRGHVHEGKGTKRYKRTLCINPGSMYEQGVLHGAVVELKPNKLGTYILTTG